MALKRGSEALMEIMQNEGVEYVFGIPGVTEIMFMSALEKHPEIKYILGLQEVICAGMAEGYARMSGKPGFLNLHTAPGLSAAMPILINAHMGNVPLIVTAGQQDTRLLLKDPHLTGDLVGMAKSFSKWQTEVLRTEDIPLAMERAFKMAMQPPSGPVFLSLPHDVMCNEMDFEYTPRKPLLNELRPDRNAITQAVNLLANAKPNKTIAMFVESGIARNDALSEAVHFAELTGARVYQPWMSDINFPIQHPQYIGGIQLSSPETRDMFQSVDVLVIIGCPSLYNLPYFEFRSILPKDIKILQLDDNPWEIAKNFPITVGIQGHIKASLRELIDNLEEKMTTEAKQAVKSRINDISVQKQAVSEAFRKQDEAEKDNIPISVSWLMRELNRVITRDTVIVDDCWSSSRTLQRVLDITDVKGFIRSRRGGSIGWGLPGAIGAKLGAPNRPVVAVCGDGSAMWSIQALWTAAHCKIPVTFLIISNANYRQAKLMWKVFLGGDLTEKRIGMDLDDPVINFCKLAEAMGVYGEKVQHPDNLGQVLTDAIDSNAPRLIEAIVENKNTP